MLFHKCYEKNLIVLLICSLISFIAIHYPNNNGSREKKTGWLNKLKGINPNFTEYNT